MIEIEESAQLLDESCRSGEVMRSAGIGEVVGEVVASNAPDLPTGSRVFGLVGWQDYAVLDAASLTPVPDGAIRRRC